MRRDVRVLRDRIAATRAKLERLEAERDELVRVAARKGIDVELLAEDAGLDVEDVRALEREEPATRKA